MKIVFLGNNLIKLKRLKNRAFESKRQKYVKKTFF